MRISLKVSLSCQIILGVVGLLAYPAWADDSRISRNSDAAAVENAPQTEAPFVCPQVLPDGTSITWGKEPEEVLSPVRAQVVLNGPWQFMPSVEKDQKWSEEPWGWIRVPGSWTPSWTEPGILIDCPNTPMWMKYYGSHRNGEIGRAHV